MRGADIEAVVFHAPGDVRVERVPAPACGPGEVRVRVELCAVCGSDLKSYRNGNPRIRPPIILGHEFTGPIESVGAGVEVFSAGDRVVMATSVSCGGCAYCRMGHPNLCAEIAPMGFRYPGGMAELVTIPALALRNGHVVPVPPGIPPTRAALAEPLSCAVNAIENCELRPGETVAVLGAGPMGILNALVARRCGAGRVLLAEVNPARLERARAFGFDWLVNPAERDLGDAVREATGGLGADVVIVAAPAAGPQQQALALARKRGRICLFASLPRGASDIVLDSRAIHYGELRVLGSSDSTPAHVRRAVAMLADPAFPAGALVTHTLPLGEIGRAFELMETGEALRVALRPGPVDRDASNQ